jgi:hypothetical protein
VVFGLRVQAHFRRLQPGNNLAFYFGASISASILTAHYQQDCQPKSQQPPFP